MDIISASAPIAASPTMSAEAAQLPTSIVSRFVHEPMALFLLMMFVGLLFILVYTQFKKDGFDLRYLISDDQKRPSLHKIGQLTALMVSTWAFVFEVLHNQMTDTFYTVYMGIWASITVLNKWADRNPGNYVVTDSHTTVVSPAVSPAESPANNS